MEAALEYCGFCSVLLRFPAEIDSTGMALYHNHQHNFLFKDRYISPGDPLCTAHAHELGVTRSLP